MWVQGIRCEIYRVGGGKCVDEFVDIGIRC